MKFLITLIFVFVSFTQIEIQLSENPTNKGSVKLSLLHTFDGGEDGYYNQMTITLAENGKYVVKDQGNNKVFIYSEKFEEEYVFGKNGNGPGEFGKYLNVVAVKDRLYLATPQKVMSYGYDARFINEAKISFIGRFNLTFNDDGFYFETRDGSYKKYAFDKDANLIEKKIGKEKSTGSAMRNGTSIRYVLPAKWKNLPFKIEASKAEYKLSLVDKTDGKVTHELTRPFTRIKRKPIENFRIVDGKKVPKSSKSLAHENAYRKRIGDYKADASWALGEVNAYLFILVASEDEDTRKIDIISPDFQFYDQLVIKNKDIQFLRLEYGKLLLTCKNDDIGPYAEVYDVKIN
jgi:hypothetical protein